MSLPLVARTLQDTSPDALQLTPGGLQPFLTETAGPLNLGSPLIPLCHYSSALPKFNSMTFIGLPKRLYYMLDFFVLITITNWGGGGGVFTTF